MRSRRPMATRAQLPAFELADHPEHQSAESSCSAASPRRCASNWTLRRRCLPCRRGVSIGLPAELARRRPDIREAEANLHAATAQIGVAVADLFPRLTLAGNGGFQSENDQQSARLGQPLRLLRARARSAGLRSGPLEDGAACTTCARRKPRSPISAPCSTRCMRSRTRWPPTAPTSSGAPGSMPPSPRIATALALSRKRYESGVATFIDVLDVERTLQQNELVARRQRHRRQRRPGAPVPRLLAAAGNQARRGDVMPLRAAFRPRRARGPGRRAGP